MAEPNLTVGQLAVALGISGAEDADLDDATAGILTRLLAVASSLVTTIAPNAPREVANEAVVRVAAYQYDSDPAAPGRGRTDVVTASGAGSLLSRWRSVGLRLPTGAPVPGAGVAPAPGGVDPGAVNALIAAALAVYVPIDATARGMAAAAAAVAGAALPADDPAVARIPSANPPAARVWKSSSGADPVPGWRPDATGEGGGGGATDLAPRVFALEQRVHPILELPRAWAGVSDAAVAGWSAPEDLSSDVAVIAALDFNNAAVAGAEDKVVYVRIRPDAQQSAYRFQYVIGGGAQDGETHNRVLGTWSGERIGADDDWAYYRIAFFEGSSFSAGKLQAGTGGFEWEGLLTRQAVADQLAAIGIPRQIQSILNVTRDLLLEGATRLVANSDIDVAAVARVALKNADRLAIEDGTKKLDVQGVNFTATLANAHFGSTGSSTDEPVIRVVDSEHLGDWRIDFDGTQFLAGGWVEIEVDNGTPGYRYFVSGKVDRTALIRLLKTTAEATYHGALAAGIVDIDALAAAVAARLLPTGGSDGQLVGRASGAPAWVAAPEGGGGFDLSGELGSDVQNVAAQTWTKISGNGVWVAGKVIWLGVRIGDSGYGDFCLASEVPLRVAGSNTYGGGYASQIIANNNVGFGRDANGAILAYHFLSGAQRFRADHIRRVG